jgi:hypothetical protein
VIQSDPGSLDQYFRVVAQTGRIPDNVRFYMNYVFHGIDFQGKVMLDVGGGDGIFSFYATCAGADKVVCLEPEMAGSTNGAVGAFKQAAFLLDSMKVQLIPQRLQDYESGDSLFDVLLLHASINHLDEKACIRLRDDREAQRSYAKLFGKLASLASPRAAIVIIDCARRNLFADLGVKNPITPTIEWEKHQSPALWAHLLTQAGFAHPVIRWSSFNSLRSFGRVFLGNRIAAYCLTSSFCLTMERQ